LKRIKIIAAAKKKNKLTNNHQLPIFDLVRYSLRLAFL
jgi:hypothetical protein